ncbi:MAG TPA: flagellar hook-associated protein FlgK, partial [Sedimenticola sp.]|nr:flagellar hook-associated protein FlgK [Sedimenticola sp.]
MAGLLEIGVSGLMAFQRSINTTGHNIANSDTEGYSRQRVELSTQTPHLTGAGWLGSGVKVAAVQRSYDDFLATQMRAAQSTASGLDVYAAHAGRIDNLLADPNVGLDPSVQDFFDAMQVLADNPASIPSRQALISETASMVDRFHDLSRQFNTIREQTNQELSAVVDEINGLSRSLARVNQNIIEAIGASGGDDPNDLLDEREVLLNQLSERVAITTVPQDDGALNIFIGKGQALVIGGTAASLSTVQSELDLGRYDIAFTDATGSRVITDQLAGGEIGGLLSFREEIVDPAQNQLGLVAVGLSRELNAQHRLGLDLDGSPGGALFSDPQIETLGHGANRPGATATATFTDTGELAASDYLLEATGPASFTLTRLADGSSWNLNNQDRQDGIQFSIGGAADAGDRFLIQPVRWAADRIRQETTDPRRLAAAAPVRALPAGNLVTPGPNLGGARVSQPEISDTGNLPVTIDLTWSPDLDNDGVEDDPGFQVVGGPGGTLAYDPATDSGGKRFTFPGFGNMTFSVSGVPAAGDSFRIEENAGGVADNRNALAMAAIQGSDRLLGETGG